MGLETATYINELITTNPVGGDQLSQADDHIRLLKTTLQASFPKDLRAVSSPLNYLPLRYNGTSFRNYNNGCYTNLALSAPIFFTQNIPFDVTFQQEIQDDLGLYAGTGADIVIPSNFPTGVFGCFLSVVIGVPASIPTGGALTIEMPNITSTSREPMRGLATRNESIIFPPTTSLPVTPHKNILLFMYPNNVNKPLAGDVLRLRMTSTRFDGSILNGNLQFFVL